jgi:hypothetical protein
VNDQIEAYVVWGAAVDALMRMRVASAGSSHRIGAASSTAFSNSRLSWASSRFLCSHTT